MKVFIPSRDRASQLDCLIRSMEQNLPNIDFDIHITYKTTSDSFYQGYRKLKQAKFKNNVEFHYETDFSCDFFNYLRDNKEEFVMLLTDDCVFYRKYPKKEADLLCCFTDNIYCWSSRLGLNTTTQWYMTGEQQEELENSGGYDYCGLDCNGKTAIIQWNWKIRPAFQNYGYFVSWDGVCYRGSDLLELARKIDFYNPRTFEDRLTKDQSIRNGIARKYMCSPEESILFVNTINCVQEEGPPAGSKYQISVEELNEKYLRGEIIDMKSFDGLSLSGSHDEIPLLFKKEI